jgi:hypothetical protein
LEAVSAYLWSRDTGFVYCILSFQKCLSDQPWKIEPFSSPGGKYKFVYYSLEWIYSLPLEYTSGRLLLPTVRGLDFLNLDFLPVTTHSLCKRHRSPLWGLGLGDLVHMRVLWLLWLLQVIKSFVSESGILCVFTFSIQLCQANLLAWKRGKIFDFSQFLILKRLRREHGAIQRIIAFLKPYFLSFSAVYYENYQVYSKASTYVPTI